MLVYIYETSTGLMQYQDMGSPQNVIDDIPIGCDFTLKAPPNNHDKWRWIDDKWTTDQPS